ncbi:MAG TPA: hypothetical protein VF316_05190 [Polyangiaceae bacterium]
MAPGKPRYDLEAAKKAPDIQISTSCARKANEVLLCASDSEARKYIRGLFQTLTPADFAHVQPMRGASGPTIYGDVYGKKDEFGLWFFKFSFDGTTTTVIMSCHEAEHDITLADDRTLRKPRP